MFQLLSRIVCTTVGCIYPVYRSYKAIKANDSQNLEIWVMYWAVMGTVVTYEMTVEWVVSWFPFYYPVKTLVILWLALPQIQGSSYVYITLLHPLLNKHEQDIDAALSSAHSKAKESGLYYISSGINRLKELVFGPSAVPNIQSHPSVPNLRTSNSQPDATAAAQLFGLAGTYLKTYAPGAVAAGQAIFQPMKGRQPSVRSQPSANASGSRLTFTQLRQRRTELEAQIADIDAQSTSSSYLNLSHMNAEPNSPGLSSGKNSDASISRDPGAQRIERSFANLGYEEIDRTELDDYNKPERPAGWFWESGTPRPSPGNIGTTNH